jgi:VanZ family protein
VKTDAPLEPPVSVAAALPTSAFAGFLRYWLPVLLWCAVIYGFSTDAGSTHRTSRILGPILRWFNPNISEEAIRRVQFGVRKTAHVAEYAVLALLSWRALRKPARNDGRPWNWREAGLAIAFVVVFAISDEVHQLFVPSRQAQVSDVFIDSLGAALGLLALRAYGRWRARW